MGNIKRSPVWPDPRVKPPYGSVEIDWGHPLAQCLVGSWLMNEGAGATLYDVRGVIPGTFEATGQPAWIADVLGSGLTFNGSTAAVDLGNPPALQMTDVLTIHTAFIPGVGVLVGKDTDTPSNNRAYTLDISGGNLRTYYGGVVFANLAVTAGRLYHAVCVYNAPDSGSVAAYLDTGASASASGGPGAIPSSASNVHIGRREYVGNFDYFTGKIFYVNIFHRALTAAEAATLLAEPYAFLRPVIRRRYFVPQSGAAAAARVVSRRLPLLGVGS